MLKIRNIFLWTLFFFSYGFRYYASDDDIRRAYRKIVLRHHPDKRKGQGKVDINPDDDYFTCITRAYEFLGNQQKRRSYDSIDPLFNDDLPTQSEIDKDYFGALAPCFKLNSRWSEKKNVPLMGNDKSERSHVEKFYDFWYVFQSWREYSYLDEEDKDKGQDRDERRWIDKQNKVQRTKRKKEEMTRIRQLIDLAYNNDPRIGRFKRDEKEKKLAAKRAKQDAVQQQKADEDRVIKEAAAAKLKAEQAEQKRIEQLQKEREVQKRALKKERKALRDFVKSKGYYTDNDDKFKITNMENLEKICESFKLMELQELNKKFQSSADGQLVFVDAVNVMEIQLNEERKQNLQNNGFSNIGRNTTTPVAVVPTVNKKLLWTNENVQLLIKSVNLFPAGTNQRWDVVANFVNLHAINLSELVQFTAKDVLNKAKEIQSSDFTKNDLKAQVNNKAFEAFEKNKKELKVIDNSEISAKDPGELANGGNKVKVNGEKPKMMNGHTEPEKKEVKESSNNNNTTTTNKGKETKENNNKKKDNNKNNKGKDAKENKGVNVVAVTEQIVEQPVKLTNGTGGATSIVADTKTWTKDEQALLEQAIKTFPVATAERWERIAECVPNRTKKDCLRRVKELVELLNEKKKAQQIK